MAEGPIPSLRQDGRPARVGAATRRRSDGGDRSAPSAARRDAFGREGLRGGSPAGGRGKDAGEERVVTGPDGDGNQASGSTGASARPLGSDVNARSELALRRGERLGGHGEAKLGRIGGAASSGWKIGLGEVRGQGRRATSGRRRGEGHPDLRGPVPGPRDGGRRGATGGAEEQAEGQERDLARGHTVLCSLGDEASPSRSVAARVAGVKSVAGGPSRGAHQAAPLHRSAGRW